MTDIEALRARMREAINALAAALAALKDGEPEGPRRDGLIAGIEHALNNAKPLDAEITRLREDLDRVTRERDDAIREVARLVKAREDAHGQWRSLAAERAVETSALKAALAKRDEEVARLRASMKIAVDWAEALKFFADSGTSLAPALAQLRDTLTQEPTNAE